MKIENSTLEKYREFLKEPSFEDLLEILRDFPEPFRNDLLDCNINYWQKRLEELKENFENIAQKIINLSLEEQKLLEAIILKTYESTYKLIMKRLGFLLSLKKALNNQQIPLISIDEIKNISIVEVAYNLGLSLKPVGTDKYVSFCPFHEENHPSLTFFTNSSRFYCFGCHEKGDVIDLVMKIKKLSFKQALEYLSFLKGEKS